MRIRGKLPFHCGLRLADKVSYMSTDNISKMALFAKLVEAKSFSNAAKQLNISTSLVSKQINSLEQSLGTRLLTRTTRALSLTEAGARFYKHCAHIRSVAELATEEIADLQGGPRGRLKVIVATTFGLLHVAPAIPDFLTLYPDITIELTFYDRVVDIAAEGYDLAIRIGDPVHPGLARHRLAELDWVVCGSPAYFARAGALTHPADLLTHNCLFYSYGDGYAQDSVVFTHKGTKIPIAMSGNYQVNNSAALCDAAIQGLGVAIVPYFSVGKAIKKGRLELALADYVLPTRALNAVYYAGENVPLKIEAFVNFLAQRFNAQPHWDA